MKKTHPLRLIVFLGNPDPEHRRTRHNFGWQVLDSLSVADSANWKNKFRGEILEIPLENRKIILLKPLLYMNRSGESVAAAAGFLKIPVHEILVVHDDLELPFGFMELKSGGGLGGHNGLRSIKKSLGSNDFMRLRLGISRPGRGDVSSYVLGKFTPREQEALPEILESAARLLNEIIAADASVSNRQLKKIRLV